MSLQADVTDYEMMRRCVERSLTDYGRIDGVVHAAGIAGGGVIQLKDREAANAVMDPKTKGTRILQSLFSNSDLDFIVLCSSLTAIERHFGQVDYCGANAFLDAFAEERNGKGQTAVISINWGAWKEAGMAADMNLPDDLREKALERLERFGMSSDEGVSAFRRIMDSRMERVLVSTRSFEVERVAPRESDFDIIDEISTTRSTYARPDMLSEYEEPVGGMEQTVAAVWQKYLGVSQVGRNDNFFELGGDSLLGIQIVNALKREFGAVLGVAALYEGPTVSSLSKILEQDTVAQTGDTNAESRVHERKLRRKRRATID